ncbi:uncharacterized protein LOC126775879 [Nymphalis io]|uniref:uncharacterized protein LOC126775879 n=1 Tax=Inachis io TaxID=171585 RepID=UPI00216A9F95|nr:uncharacterized protein LOC126775879 [Nymphalis io]
MFDESSNISAKTWKRTVESINKVGYSDGVTNGQSSSFQSSFDMGYAQGLRFGLEIGYKASNNNQAFETQSRDPRKINCQICLNRGALTDNVVNLYNTQKEKNEEYFKK